LASDGAFSGWISNVADTDIRVVAGTPAPTPRRGLRHPGHGVGGTRPRRCSPRRASERVTVCCLRTSRTDVARHSGRLRLRGIGNGRGCVQGPSGDQRCRCRRPAPGRSRQGLRTVQVLGVRARRPLPNRGRHGVRTPVPATGDTATPDIGRARRVGREPATFTHPPRLRCRTGSRSLFGVDGHGCRRSGGGRWPFGCSWYSTSHWRVADCAGPIRATAGMVVELVSLAAVIHARRRPAAGRASKAPCAVRCAALRCAVLC
jgi:hypothetical protein